MKKWLAIAVLSMVITSHAAEGPSCGDLRTRLGLKPDEMLSAEKLALMRDRSNADKALAELGFGMMSVCGAGVPKDVDAGIRLLEKAHAGGNEGAALVLVLLYSGSVGVPYDQAKLLQWMEISAKQGQADAQAGVGALYFQGALLKKDDVAAERWWLKAAAQGHAKSYTLLGNFYFSRQMYGEALRWFSLGATLGSADAQVGLGALYSGGFGVARDHGLALQWWNAAADKKAPAAQFALGTAYKNGWGVPRDSAQAVRWFQLAAEQGSAAAQDSLANAYEFADGVPPDAQAAQKWRKQAASNVQQADPANMRLYPDCCVEDSKLAFAEVSKPYRLDAASGSSESQLVLARFLMRNKSPDEALTWYQRAIAQGNITALEELGTIYMFGRGVPADAEQGLKFSRLAAEKGRAMAQARLADVYQKGIFVRQSFVAAYALYAMSRSADTNMDRLLRQNHTALEEVMSKRDVDRAKQLVRDMAAPGALLSALDRATPP